MRVLRAALGGGALPVAAVIAGSWVAQSGPRTVVTDAVAPELPALLPADPPAPTGPSADPVVLTATVPSRVDAAPGEGVERMPPPAEPATAREIFRGDTSRRWVALTFDDGPSRENTPRILDVLRRLDVRATFFVLGRRVDRMPDLLERIDSEGHEIGNHTWSHPSMRSLWQSQIREELVSTSDVIRDLTGKTPALVRPPFGRYAPSALPLFAELGLDAVLWSVDSLDWDENDPVAIASTVVRQASPGAIVLLHDRTSATVHALPDIIRGLRERGFELVPVSTVTGLSPYRAPATGRAATPDRR